MITGNVSSSTAPAKAQEPVCRARSRRYVAPNKGNNIGADISPWVTGAGDVPNVVKVDGSGGYAYGNSGPESDASNNGAGAGVGVGVAQQYLDVTNGSNDFYQTFSVPSCPGVAGQKRTISYSGWFSTRDNLRSGSVLQPGDGKISIRQGAGLGGTLLAEQSVALPDPVPLGGTGVAGWIRVTGVYEVDAGAQVSFVVSMSNYVNFDEGFFDLSSPNCISADDDSSGSIGGAAGGPAGNAYANDSFNGAPLDLAAVTGSVIAPANPASPGAPVPARSGYWRSDRA